MLRKEVQLWQKEILVMNSDFRQGLFTRAMMLTAKQEQLKDLSQWQTAMNSRMILYTRNGGSNQQYLQEKLASLEGGEDCVVLASGVAALSGLFFALLKSGDHVVFSSVTYIAVYRLLNELLKDKFGVETTIVDTTDIEKVKAAIRPKAHSH